MRACFWSRQRACVPQCVLVVRARRARLHRGGDEGGGGGSRGQRGERGALTVAAFAHSGSPCVPA
eukprot:5344103-Alexandrium_andersonii.AAC.1